MGAGEEIDMPVFFFIDPEIVKDPAMDGVNIITLSYTFFLTGEDEVVVKDARKEKTSAESSTGSSSSSGASGGGQSVVGASTVTSLT